MDVFCAWLAAGADAGMAARDVARLSCVSRAALHKLRGGAMRCTVELLQLTQLEAFAASGGVPSLWSRAALRCAGEVPLHTVRAVAAVSPGLWVGALVVPLSELLAPLAAPCAFGRLVLVDDGRYTLTEYRASRAVASSRAVYAAANALVRASETAHVTLPPDDPRLANRSGVTCVQNSAFLPDARRIDLPYALAWPLIGGSARTTRLAEALADERVYVANLTIAGMSHGLHGGAGGVAGVLAVARALRASSHRVRLAQRYGVFRSLVDATDAEWAELDVLLYSRSS